MAATTSLTRLLRELNSVTIEGALFVVNDCLYLNTVEVEFNEKMFEGGGGSGSSIPGMSLPPVPGVFVNLVWESFPEHYIEAGPSSPYGGEAQ